MPSPPVTAAAARTRRPPAPGRRAGCSRLSAAYPLDHDGGGDHDEEGERVDADERDGAEHDAGDRSGDRAAEPRPSAPRRRTSSKSHRPPSASTCMASSAYTSRENHDWSGASVGARSEQRPARTDDPRSECVDASSASAPRTAGTSRGRCRPRPTSRAPSARGGSQEVREQPVVQDCEACRLVPVDVGVVERARRDLGWTCASAAIDRPVLR